MLRLDVRTHMQQVDTISATPNTQRTRVVACVCVYVRYEPHSAKLKRPICRSEDLGASQAAGAASPYLDPGLRPGYHSTLHALGMGRFVAMWVSVEWIVVEVVGWSDPRENLVGGTSDRCTVVWSYPFYYSTLLQLGEAWRTMAVIVMCIFGVGVLTAVPPGGTRWHMLAHTVKTK